MTKHVEEESEANFGPVGEQEMARAIEINGAAN